MNITDARVRLPQDRRTSASYSAPARQTEQYDRVLGLTDKMNGGTLSGLLKEMDAVGISRAVMHAESEGGEDADALRWCEAALAGARRLPFPDLVSG